LEQTEGETTIAEVLDENRGRSSGEPQETPPTGGVDAAKEENTGTAEGSVMEESAENANGDSVVQATHPTSEEMKENTEGAAAVDSNEDK
jgi:hypothetical protein